MVYNYIDSDVGIKDSNKYYVIYCTGLSTYIIFL